MVFRFNDSRFQCNSVHLFGMTDKFWKIKKVLFVQTFRLFRLPNTNFKFSRRIIYFIVIPVFYIFKAFIVIDNFVSILMFFTTVNFSWSWFWAVASLFRIFFRIRIDDFEIVIIHKVIIPIISGITIFDFWIRPSKISFLTKFQR